MHLYTNDNQLVLIFEDAGRLTAITAQARYEPMLYLADILIIPKLQTDKGMIDTYMLNLTKRISHSLNSNDVSKVKELFSQSKIQKICETKHDVFVTNPTQKELLAALFDEELQSIGNLMIQATTKKRTSRYRCSIL